MQNCVYCEKGSILRNKKGKNLLRGMIKEVFGDEKKFRLYPRAGLAYDSSSQTGADVNIPVAIQHFNRES